MGNVIMVTSCKGGVGKTTLTAGIAASLSMRENSVIAVDMDFGVRSLDLALGFEDCVCSDAYDFISGKCKPEEAYTAGSVLPDLKFMPAPVGFDSGAADAVTREQIDAFLVELKKRFDYVLLDMPAGFGRFFDLVASSPQTDLPIVVCSHSPSAVRAAEKTAFELYRRGKTDPRLIINMFNVPFVKKGYYPGIIDIIERSSVKLLGVVPADSAIDSIQQRGGLINCLTLTGNGSTAVSNIARRLEGEHVSLLHSIMKAAKRERLL